MEKHEYKSKLDERLSRLIRRHAQYLNNLKNLKFPSNSDAMKEGLFLIEDELCFLLSFLTDQELESFNIYSNIDWTDEVEFINNRPQIKIPLKY
ncbi:hypothetical protein CUC43_25655 [Bacillus thuringiensis LM1212]|uniref:hypothetical protein n=1 Tax=Bacillus cereus group TaxID=86661 RepID=UPI000417E54F|nr:MULTISPECIES: hypothetical protein [Bacillus cereus group]AXY09926.1 hypothetical protein CUC43_25655 [Bacillus thuringiensis LM1212]QDF22826.1 hypothetical protein FJR70_07230 [Bacillus tropicus]QUG96147.1 hypothetical protein HCM98_14915 [Bacillus tropicus]